MKNNKLLFLFILNIIIILVVILLFNIVLNNIEYPAAATVTESDNGTVIEIKSVINWKITLFLCIVITVLDCIIFTTFKILQHLRNKRIKEKYTLIIICIFNLLFTILLFPGTMLSAVIIDALLIMIYIIKSLMASAVNSR